MRPVLPFYMALGLAKKQFHVFSDASGGIGLGGFAFFRNEIQYWCITFKELLQRYNKKPDFFVEDPSTSIQMKEMLSLAFNVECFGEHAGSDVALCMNTDNLGLAANLAKFRAKHDNFTNDLIIWIYLYSLAYNILMVPYHKFREVNVEADLLSKNKIGEFYALCRSKYQHLTPIRVFPNYAKVFDLNI